LRPDKTFSPLPNKDGENAFLVLADTATIEIKANFARPVTTLNQDTGDTGLWTPNSQQVNRLSHGLHNQKIHRAQRAWDDTTY
jgi:hypothetical protein